MRRVIVDTSVFAEFFRGRGVPRLEALLRTNAAILSPFVRLELLQGVQRREARLLADLLRGLTQLPHRDDLFPLAEAMLDRVRGSGITVSVVDLLIAAQARQYRCAV